MTFKWLDLSCLYQSRPTWENRNHCKSFNIGNLIQRIWLHRWRNCWGAKGNSEASQRLVVARGSYHPNKEQQEEMLLSESRNPGCPEGLERWSWGLLGRGWNHGDLQSVLGGRGREEDTSTPLLSPHSSPLASQSCLEARWQENLGNRCSMEQSRDLRANVLDQNTAFAVNLWTSSSSYVLKSYSLFF